MNICVVACEYNPFHNGHIFHINQTKKFFADQNQNCILVGIMSGNFVQRGEIACCEKYVRARIAVENGLDAVIELPTAFAISNAEMFARGVIKIASSIDAVSHISFGSETADLPVLTKTATKDNSQELKSSISQGVSYARAMAQATQTELCPNDILAVEYLKQLHNANKSITPIVVKRQGSYHSIDNVDGFMSATAIRHGYDNNQDISGFLPKQMLDALKPADHQQLGKLLLYKLRTMTAHDLSQIYNVSEGLQNRIISCAKKADSYTELIHSIKTKRYTMSRIKRILLAALLDITKTDMMQYTECTPYLKILAVKDKSVLSLLGGNNYLLYRNSDTKKITDEITLRCVGLDNNADNIYRLLIT